MRKTLQTARQPMNIGYACLAIAVPGSNMKNCTLKNSNKENLLSLIDHNLNSLETLIDYNIQNGISLFRISSDLIPFGSSEAYDLPWQNIYSKKLSIIGNKIIGSGMRVSMHPGQYTVLNSPDISVVKRAIQDLNYHTKVLDCLGLGPEHKIVLHLGGAYGDKEKALERFISRFKELGESVRRRLVIENDDRSFNIGDVLKTSAVIGVPVVFDNLHNALNPADSDTSEINWITKCAVTWKSHDGQQKIHYSQQNIEKKTGAHSVSINIDIFLDFYRQLNGMNLDVMLEVKDKNISALKCINCTSNRGIKMLEVEWSRYKYYILERSSLIYGEIRQLLNDKSTYPASEMYRMIDEASEKTVITGNAVNAAQHVWGYFRDKASETEKNRFERSLEKFTVGDTGLKSIKNNLLALAIKYNEGYLLGGYYFYL